MNINVVYSCVYDTWCAGESTTAPPDETPDETPEEKALRERCEHLIRLARAEAPEIPPDHDHVIYIALDDYTPSDEDEVCSMHSTHVRTPHIAHARMTGFFSHTTTHTHTLFLFSNIHTHTHTYMPNPHTHACYVFHIRIAMRVLAEILSLL